MSNKQLDDLLDTHLEIIAKLMNTQDNCSSLDEQFVLSVFDAVKNLQQNIPEPQDEAQLDKQKKIYEALSTLLARLITQGEKEKKAISDELLLLQRRKSAKQQYQP